jgi:hypothetical protein
MISAHNPASAREANWYLLEIIGIILMAPGIAFGYAAVTVYPVTRMTWLMAAALLIYLIERGRRVLIPKGERLSIEEWKRQHGVGAVFDQSQVKPIEALVSPDVARDQVRTERSQARKWAPLIAIFAVVLAAIGLHQSINLAHLEASGLRAPGQVMRLKEESSSGNSRSYYPIVQFRAQDNTVVEFKDSVGSNPPMYRPGDRVNVLYLASNPHGQAIIDRGRVWNWAIPGILFLAAFAIAALFILLLRRGVSRPPIACSAN